MLAYSLWPLCRMLLAAALSSIASGVCRLLLVVTQGNAVLVVADVDGGKAEPISSEGDRDFVFADRLIHVHGGWIVGIGASLGFASLKPPFGNLTAAS